VRQAMCRAVYDATQLVCHTLPQHSTFSTLQVFPWEVVKNGEDCGGCAGSENGQLQPDVQKLLKDGNILKHGF